MKRVALVVLFLSCLGWSQEVSELAKAKILNSYRKALLAQVAAQQTQQTLQTALEEYKTTWEEAVKAAHLPEGTTVSVDTNKDAVSFVAPPKKPEKAAEKK